MIIKPFRGFRPIPELAPKVALNPNNLLNETERMEEARKNPYSFAHVVKPRINFPDETLKTHQQLFDFAREYFQRMVNEGTLVRDEEPCLYVYRLSLEHHSQTGLICCLHIKDYNEGRIKKHEHTRAEKENENLLHIRSTLLNSNPVFLAYTPVPEIDKVITSVTEGNDPGYNFINEYNVQQELWVVSEQELIHRLTRLFDHNVSCSYIADGHHRAAAAALYAKQMEDKEHTLKSNDFNYMLTCLFPSNQHDIRRLPNGNITLFDNGNWHPIPRSYAKEYLLDEVNKTATLVWSYTLPPIDGAIVVSWAMGNVQRLSNGNTLINWATFVDGPDVTEVDSNGNIVWSFSLTNNDSTSYATYRTHRYEWKPCARPTAGLMSTSNISVSSAQLNWTNATNASYYKIEYRTSNANSWIEAHVPAGTTFYPVANLKPSTSYSWRIQSFCDSLNTSSNYSTIQSFTTLSDTLVPTDPPINPQPFFIYPNPARDQLYISIAMEEPGNVKLRLVNLPGQLIKQGEWFSSETEDIFILPVETIPAGMYLVELYYDEKKVVQKVVIE